MTKVTLGRTKLGYRSSKEIEGMSGNGEVDSSSHSNIPIKAVLYLGDYKNLPDTNLAHTIPEVTPY